MPIYQYRCHECGEVSEFLLPDLSESRILTCSACESHNLERLISAPSLLRKSSSISGETCCGREERCESPSCSTGERCRGH